MIVFLSDEKCPKTKLPEFFWQFMRSKCHKFISENLCARNMWIFECGSALSNRQNNTNIQTLSHDEHRLVTCTFERQHGPSPKKTHLGGHAFLVVTFITFKCDFVSRSVLFTWIWNVRVSWNCGLWTVLHWNQNEKNDTSWLLLESVTLLAVNSWQ